MKGYAEPATGLDIAGVGAPDNNLALAQFSF